MSVRLYVGNLPEELSRQELEAIFADAGTSVSTKLITDRKTNKCRGFGFVTIKTEEQADEFIEKYNGHLLNDTPIKIERAQPRSKEESPVDPPTPSGRNKKAGAAKQSSSRRTSGSGGDTDSIQPDPRWAQDLEKLKQLLAAQATNP